MVKRQAQDYFIAVHESGGEQSIVPVDRFPFRIGRAADNELMLDDQSVSRRHAILRRDESGLAVVDNKSRNGVFVNDLRVSSPQPLRPGDTLRLGTVVLRLDLESHVTIPDRSTGRETVSFFPTQVEDPLLAISRTFAKRRSPDKWPSFVRLFLDAPLPTVYDKILDLIEESAVFDRCFIIRFEDEGLEKLDVIAKRAHVELGDTSHVIVSHEILRRVAESRESVVVTTEDIHFKPSESFLLSGAAAAVCVPLAVEGRVTGVIYLDGNEVGKEPQETLEALRPLASLIALKIENVKLTEEHVSAQVTARDLKRAEEIMGDLLPARRLAVGGWDIEGYSLPCHEVGGDYHDYFSNESELVFVIGDVSGKGLPSALYVAGVRATLHAHRDGDFAVDSVMSGINRHVVSTFRSDHFLTLFIGKLDLESGSVSYCNAGHLRPICMRPDGTVVEVDTTDPALNLVGAHRFSRGEFSLARGDTLLLYTDGLVEAESSSGEQFGEQRLVETLVERRSTSLPQLMEHLFTAVESFARTATRHDDQTALLVRRR